jgi:hypothetical protein
LKPRSPTPSAALTTAYAAVAKMFTAGSVTSAGDVLAPNFLMDRDAEHRARDFAELKAQVGGCDTSAPIAPTGALAGDFIWGCELGRVKGQVLLAPTPTPRISVAYPHPVDALKARQVWKEQGDSARHYFAATTTLTSNRLVM